MAHQPSPCSLPGGRVPCSGHHKGNFLEKCPSGDLETAVSQKSAPSRAVKSAASWNNAFVGPSNDSLGPTGANKRASSGNNSLRPQKAISLLAPFKGQLSGKVPLCSAPHTSNFVQTCPSRTLQGNFPETPPKGNFPDPPPPDSPPPQQFPRNMPRPSKRAVSWKGALSRHAVGPRKGICPRKCPLAVGPSGKRTATACNNAR